MFAMSGNTIESDEGFSVATVGRAGLRYREGGRSLFVDSEFLVGPTLMVVYSSRMRWEHSGEQADAATKLRVAENIRRAAESQGYRIRIDP